MRAISTLGSTPDRIVHTFAVRDRTVRRALYMWISVKNILRLARSDTHSSKQQQSARTR